MLDYKFAKELLSIPSYTDMEDMLIEYIKYFCEQNNISYYQDEMRNLYLTKGTLNEGEYYPCTTSHLDTVQDWQCDYIDNIQMLPIEMEKKANKTYLYSKYGGVGADCKIGIVVCLSLFQQFDKMKCALFTGEEELMKGSSNLDISFFKDVGYVIGFDSPDLNRASFSCFGTQLFSNDFFNGFLKGFCNVYGVTKFNHEPYTDVVQIRKKTGLTCMNFGSGGYMAHTNKEYVCLEDTNACYLMAIDLISSLGNKLTV